MVTTKHCCYGGCTTDSRILKPGEDEYFIGFGNGFPKPAQDREKCERWVQNCGRKYFTIDNVTKDTYICSKHFVGGRGPTAEYPDPIKCGTQVTTKRRRPEQHHEYRSPKQMKLERSDAAQNLLLLKDANESDVGVVGSSAPEVPSTSHTKTIPDQRQLFISVGTTCKPSVRDHECQTENPLTTEVIKLRIQNKILENSTKLNESVAPFALRKPVGRKQTSDTSTAFHDTFNVDSVKDDDKAFKLYTGLTYIQFMCLWDFLGKCTEKMNYWNSNVSDANKTPSKSRGRKRTTCMSPMNQLFMTLIRLRLGLLNQDLAYRFKTSTCQVSTIIIKWIQLLYKQFYALRKAMFASRRKVRKHLPKCFKKYKNIRCIIDCTEVHVQSPGNFEAQGNQYSSYKGYTSYKFLVASAPNGAIAYVSDAFEGSISDKEIVKQSDFLDFLEPGDVIMADRGFLIDDLLNERQVKMIRPPFLGTRHRFTPQEEAATKDIAKHRIHVERSIERMKKFKILQRIIPQSLQPVFTQCVFVISCLVNFQAPLVE